MRRIYVAGPMTIGDREQNLRMALDAGQKLLKAGFAPLVPQLSYYWGDVYPNSHREWLELDLAWVAVSDAMLVLPGKSVGTTTEQRYAKKLSIPIFDEIKDLFAANIESRFPTLW